MESMRYPLKASLSPVQCNTPDKSYKKLCDNNNLLKTFQSKAGLLEGELAKTRVENDKLVYELKIAKTRVAQLEEKLAKTEIESQNKNKHFNVTVHNNNYGCFGFNLFSSFKIKLEDEL